MPTNTTATRTALQTLCAVVAIVATYLYFISYTKLALIVLVQQTLGKTDLPLILSALALGGIMGSLTCALTHKPTRARLWYCLGQLLCAIGAAASLFSLGLISFTCTYFIVGLGLGWSTVSLSLCLRPTLHLPKLGWWCGIGIGIAYFIANQPWLFQATPRHQSITACIIAIIGLLASLGLRGEPSKSSHSPEYSLRGWIIWSLIFFILVWLDSIAVHGIQHAERLKTPTWDSIFTFEGVALLQFLVALLSGYMLDRRVLTLIIVFSFLFLVASCLVLNWHNRYLPLSRVFYITASSLYAAALIYIPARSGRPLYIAGLFSISIWISSALAFGTTHNLKHISLWLLLGAGILFTITLLFRTSLKAKT